jgi:hypothetical protein
MYPNVAINSARTSLALKSPEDRRCEVMVIQNDRAQVTKPETELARATPPMRPTYQQDGSSRSLVNIYDKSKLPSQKHKRPRAC